MKAEKLIPNTTRLRRALFLTVSTAALAVCALAAIPDAEGDSHAGLALPVPGLFSGFERCMALAGLLALTAFFWHRLARLANSRSKVSICLKCNRVKLQESHTQCGCGGEFFSMEELKWVADTNGNGGESKL